MSLVEEVRQSWGWVGIEPVEVVGENDFGNLIIKDEDGKYWRLSPEDYYCKVIAANRAELDALSSNQDFLQDWYMAALVSLANDQCGPLSEGRKYCLKIPSVLGGAYGGDNLATAPQVELVRFSGHIARQIEELPDGAQIKLRVTE
ncbi:T6SS immunity protein Tdi1 domain-containing protein [Leptothrix ochracea]|uniref:T6SS immunity protein Tdi1 domain-containing protein n=1 Tax=Leptothrix ochracea TaxID=735331 RepID=UPI0034E27130